MWSLKNPCKMVAIFCMNPVEKVKEKIERARKKRGGEEKKAMAAILVFMLTSLEIYFFQEKNLRGELYFGCDVIQESSVSLPL